MSAREVIARALFEREHHSSLAGRSFARADIAIEALTAAGYRILGPDELDPVTVERCQAEVESACEASHSDIDVIRSIRRRLRSLGGGR